MACLFVIQGRDQGKRSNWTRPSSAWARSHQRDPLARRRGLRRHAQIVQRPRNFKLVDLGSSNGTFVNEQQIEQHVLQSGDRVQVGRTLMIFTGNEDRSSVDLAAEVDIIDAARRPKARESCRRSARSRAAIFSRTPNCPPVPGWPGPAATCRSCTARRWRSATRWTSTNCCSGSWS